MLRENLPVRVDIGVRDRYRSFPERPSGGGPDIGYRSHRDNLLGESSCRLGRLDEKLIGHWASIPLLEDSPERVTMRVRARCRLFLE